MRARSHLLLLISVPVFFSLITAAAQQRGELRASGCYFTDRAVEVNVSGLPRDVIVVHHEIDRHGFTIRFDDAS